MRRTRAIRAFVRETSLDAGDLVYPMFVVPGRGVRRPIDSMPGVCHLSADEVAREAARIHELGIGGVLLFGVPEQKDPEGSGAWTDDGVVQEAVRSVAGAIPGLCVITDVCLCEYTDHGHCGIIEDGEVANDPTLELLARQAVSHARAGANMVAPSDMMDGRVGRIRAALDDAGYDQLPIMSYSAKYASAFYGPFRAAAASAPKMGDRKSYQMDPGNAREALREVRLDVEEGADIVMVKPAALYLDVIRMVRDEFLVPVAAYQVSGEYAMIKAAASKGWIDEERAILESLLSIKRAGADLIMTYFAPDAARLIERR